MTSPPRTYPGSPTRGPTTPVRMEGSLLTVTCSTTSSKVVNVLAKFLLYPHGTLLHCITKSDLA